MATFTGRVHLNEIRESPWRVEADESQPWVRTILERAAPSTDLTGLEASAWAERAKLKLSVEIARIGADYIVEGALSGQVQSACSRCADLFEAPRSSRFRLFLHRDIHARDADEGPSEDPDYIVFSSDHIELIDLLTEQLVILEPFAEAPPRKPNGACQLCDRNPSFEANEEAGQNAPPKASSPFLKLAELKKKF